MQRRKCTVCDFRNALRNRQAAGKRTPVERLLADCPQAPSERQRAVQIFAFIKRSFADFHNRIRNCQTACISAFAERGLADGAQIFSERQRSLRFWQKIRPTIERLNPNHGHAVRDHKIAGKRAIIERIKANRLQAVAQRQRSGQAGASCKRTVSNNLYTVRERQISVQVSAAEKSLRADAPHAFSKLNRTAGRPRKSVPADLRDLVADHDRLNRITVIHPRKFVSVLIILHRAAAGDGQRAGAAVK